MRAREHFDRRAELRLIEFGRVCIELVDTAVSFFIRPKFIDEIVFRQMEVGDVDQVRFECRERCAQRGRDRFSFLAEIIDRPKGNFWVCGMADHLREEKIVTKI